LDACVVWLYLPSTKIGTVIGDGYFEISRH
jgi:hypothetical protein